jgi:GAF domain-containing protein
MGVPDQRRRREDRLHVLSGALRAFAEATTDYERLLNVVARTVSDVVADGCIVRLLEEGGWLTPVAFHLPFDTRGTDADAVARAHTFMAAPRNVAEYAWGQHLIETGEAFILPRLEMAQFRSVVTPDVAEVYETIGIHSMLVVVLRLRGQSIGTLSLFRFDPASPSFDEADREMAQALADHAALAIGTPAPTRPNERREMRRRRRRRASAASARLESSAPSCSTSTTGASWMSTTRSFTWSGTRATSWCLDASPGRVSRLPSGATWMLVPSSSSRRRA